MCGIGGVRRWGNAPIEEDHIKMLLCALESRGRDASGVALINDGEDAIHVVKDDRTGFQFAASTRLSEFFGQHLKPETRTAIVHCRAATKGTPHTMANNHPLFSGGAAIVHNGCINNDDFLFNNLKLERQGEVDSDIIRAIADRYGLTPKAVKQLSKMSGSAAIAILHKAWPQHILLARSGSPLVLAQNEDYLFWASEKHAIYKAARPWVERHGIWMQRGRPDLDWTTMPSNTAWLIGPEGLVWHKEFKTSFGGGEFSSCDFPRRSGKSYLERQKRWSKKEEPDEKPLKKEMACPNCHRWLDVSAFKDLVKECVYCKTCRKYLAMDGFATEEKVH